MKFLFFGSKRPAATDSFDRAATSGKDDKEAFLAQPAEVRQQLQEAYGDMPNVPPGVSHAPSAKSANRPLDMNAIRRVM